jgi:hypothetical protein
VVVLVLVIGHQQFSCICGVVVVVVKTKVKSKEVRKRVQHQFYFLVSSSNKPAEEATTGAQRQTSPFGPRGSTRITTMVVDVLQLYDGTTRSALRRNYIRLARRGPNCT